jgi:MYXO-CTERM domain-containing protein
MRTQAVNDGDTALADGVTSGPKKFFGAVVDWDALYYRKYVRFGADFQQGNFMHLGGLSACVASLYPWGCMGGAGQRPAGDQQFSSNLEPWSDYQTLPWPGRWGFYSYYHLMYMDCNQPGPDDCYGDMFSPATDFFISRGEWHVLEMVIEPNTPGQADGSQTLWADGVRVYTSPPLDWRTSADVRLNEAGIYLYIHNVPAHTTDILDFDNVVFSRQYIGPAPCLEGVALGAPCRCGGVADPDDAANVHAVGTCCAGVWRSGPCTGGDGGVTPDGGPDLDGGEGGDGAAAGDAPAGGDGATGSDGAAPGDAAGSGARPMTGGCGCRVAPGAGSAALLVAALLLALLGRRRRRGAARPIDPTGPRSDM